MDDLTLARDFLAFAKTQTGGFDHTDPYRCALAQWGRARYGEAFMDAGYRDVRFVANGESHSIIVFPYPVGHLAHLLSKGSWEKVAASLEEKLGAEA